MEGETIRMNTGGRVLAIPASEFYGRISDEVTEEQVQTASYYAGKFTAKEVRTSHLTNSELIALQRVNPEALRRGREQETQNA